MTSGPCSVADPPGSPRIERSSALELRQGEHLSLLCEAPGGNPPAQLRWTLAGRHHPGYSPADGRSQLIYDVTAADNGAEVVCISSSPAQEGERRDTATITVLCEPIIE